MAAPVLPYSAAKAALCATLLAATFLTAASAAPRKGGASWPLRLAAADSPAAHHGGPDKPAPPVVKAVRVTQSGDMTRLAFDLSRLVEANAFVLADPRRVIIDLPEVDFQIDPNAGRAPSDTAKVKRGANRKASPLAGVIGSFRFGLFAAGKSRVVVDLTEPARIIQATVEPAADGESARLVLDLAKTDAAAFAGAAAAAAKLTPAPIAPPRAPVPARGDGSKLVIVVDPGHGGIDVGAHGAGDTLEKTIVFDFARTLAERLSAAGRYRVVMTRSEDIFIPLAERVRIARQAGAALFISIHADTISDAAAVSGATVYTVSDKASDAEAARVAEKENMADVAAGLDGKEDVGEISDILFDLTRRETRAYSHVFARTLIGYVKEHARLNKNPQRAAGFRVLRAPDVPSVLLELGYLSSESDLARLRSAEWREKASISVARAVDSFFKDRVPLADGSAAASGEADRDGGSVAPTIQ